MSQANNIREAAPADVALLAEIIREAFADDGARLGIRREQCPGFPSFCQPDRIEQDFQRGKRMFVLEVDGFAAGCVGMQQPDEGVCELIRLAVRPDWRRKGFGQALVEHVIARARRLGAREVALALLAENTQLLRWYEKLGFVRTGRGLSRHGPFPVVAMRMTLGHDGMR